MEVVVPEIAENVTQLEILALLVSVGELVRVNQPVVELEAAKASFELPSPATGKIERIHVGVGDDVKIGDVVLTLLPVEGRRDASQTTEIAPPTAGPAERPGPIRPSFEDCTVTIRSSIPQLALVEEIDVSALEAARRRYLDEYGVELPLIVFVIKACALALREHPRMNSSVIRQGRALAVKRYVHIGVSLQSPSSRAIPALTHADRRSLLELGASFEALAAAPPPSPIAEDLDEPTFTIIDLGRFASPGPPPITPAQVGVLGLMRPFHDGPRVALPISLACDHRVHNVASARAFLATLAELLHDPLAMLLRA
jgi:pyruvate/2-oxoglutarate dehydrogenase complex dihydrolipoamide acyltransferase (E2) component